MKKALRKENFNVRIHPQDRQLIELAAELDQRTLSDYVRGILIPAARRRLAEQTSRAA